MTMHVNAKQFIHYQKSLAHLAKRNRLRVLTQKQGIDFCSNDYLGLTRSQRIKDAMMTALENGMAVGSGGSRLLGGNHSIFTNLEIMAARFFGSEQCLYFNSGYTANLAIFASLPQRRDKIFYDEYAHASILDGIKLSRASAVQCNHNDVNDLQQKIKQWRKQGGMGRAWIAIESLYSMGGDRSPIDAYIHLLNDEDGLLMIDESHATGVFGNHGKGLAARYANRENILTLHTCGKALGVSGALLCLNKVFYDYLINHARPFIYATAASPLIAVAVQEALKILVEEPQHREQLTTLYQQANLEYAKLFGIPGTGSQILPVYINNNRLALQVLAKLSHAGFSIQAIRPPTVPEGTARIRVSITRHVSHENIIALFSTLGAFLNG